MVKVSVCLGSSRPGGLDISLRGLVDQTFEDFEIIFVDGRYHKRHERVLDYVKTLGIKQPFYHVPNHRFNKEWPTSCAGINTGFMLSEGEIVIMLLDYAYTPPGWIENHLKHHDRRRLVMSPHIYHDLPEVMTKDGEKPMTFVAGGANVTVENIVKQRENFDEISIFKTPFEPSVFKQVKQAQPPDQDPKILRPEGQSSHEYMHTKNESFLREDVLSINGMDENYDKGGGPGDLLLGWQFKMIGCELWICQEAAVMVLNPRSILPRTGLVGGTRDSVTAPFRWSYNDGERYYYATMSSEKVVSNNPYDIRKKRKGIWDWRQLSQERQPVIPYIDISDEVYYRGEWSR
jgi:glycosyltransferase involved in cell wall biosynthesis